MEKQKKAPKELSDIVRSQIGAPDSVIVDIHPDRLQGWHVTVYGQDPNLVHRLQGLAASAADQLRLRYELVEAG